MSIRNCDFCLYRYQDGCGNYYCDSIDRKNFYKSFFPPSQDTTFICMSDAACPIASCRFFRKRTEVEL